MLHKKLSSRILTSTLLNFRPNYYQEATFLIQETSFQAINFHTPLSSFVPLWCGFIDLIFYLDTISHIEGQHYVFTSQEKRRRSVVIKHKSLTSFKCLLNYYELAGFRINARATSKLS